MKITPQQETIGIGLLVLVVLIVLFALGVSLPLSVPAQ